MSQICFAGRYGAALLVNPMWTCLLRSTGLLWKKVKICLSGPVSVYLPAHQAGWKVMAAGQGELCVVNLIYLLILSVKGIVTGFTSNQRS
jgi:hypothetical protein